MKGLRRLLTASTDSNISKIETVLDRAAGQAFRASQIIRRLRDFVSQRESEKRVESLAKLMEQAGALGLAGIREQNVILRLELNAEYDRNRRSLRPPHPHHAQMTDQAKSLLMNRIFPDPLSVYQRESIGDLHQIVSGKRRTHRWFRSP